MTFAGAGEGVAGALLLFFVPGYAVAKALFPEWRVRGPGGTRRLVEIVTLSFVTSIGLTVVVGYGLLDLAPGGFSATWSDPSLEVALVAVTLVGLLAAILRGGFSRTPPPARVPPSDDGETGAWELSRDLERLGREERRLEHELRVSSGGEGETQRLRAELEAVRSERETVRREREGQYDR